VKIMIDAMCAEFGGIRTYVENLLAGWAQHFPDDEVHVALRSGSTLETPGLVRHELSVWRPDAVGRPWVQATRMHRLARRIGPDVVLATAPTTDVRRPAAPLAVVILDLRAELLPHQFTWRRRLLRTVSYGRSYRLADTFLAISQRSLDDLHRLHPATSSRPGVVTHLGADHVHSWPAGSGQGGAIAFAHHTNKNPHLVVEAWAELARRGADVPDLTLLGVSAALREQLNDAIDAHGLAGRVRLAPFLPDDDFQRTFTAASLVVFPSDFEGFGLPVVESMALGKPVVVSPDPGILEVAGGHGVVMAGLTASALADAVQVALTRGSHERETAREWASAFTWDRTIQTTRAALVALHESATSTPGRR
jgi:glycosyltransferase involved in cell wall biosynthesis